MVKVLPNRCSKIEYAKGMYLTICNRTGAAFDAYLNGAGAVVVQSNDDRTSTWPQSHPVPLPEQPVFTPVFT